MRFDNLNPFLSLKQWPLWKPVDRINSWKYRPTGQTLHSVRDSQFTCVVSHSSDCFCFSNSLLNENQLTGTIPDVLGDLDELTELYVWFSIWLFPLSLYWLSSSKNRGLGENQLTGSIPDIIGHLAKLSSLYVSRFQSCRGDAQSN